MQKTKRCWLNTDKILKGRQQAYLKENQKVYLKEIMRVIPIKKMLVTNGATGKYNKKIDKQKTLRSKYKFQNKRLVITTIPFLNLRNKKI